MIRFGVAAAVFFMAHSHALAAEDGIGRYQQMEFAGNKMTVIDTSTGQLWIVTKNEPTGYSLRQICYLGPNDQLMPTPYEDQFVDDLKRYKERCTRGR